MKRILKKAISKIKAFIKKRLDVVSAFALRVFLRGSFKDEYLFFEKIRTSKYTDSEYLLKRIRFLTHALDKTLTDDSMKPGKNIVVTIKKRLKSYEKSLMLGLTVQDPTYVWAKQILSRYKELSEGQCLVGVADNIQKFNYDELIAIIKTRRSIRSFDIEPIPDEDINQILEAGLWAPTGCNRQTIEYLLLNNPDDVKFCQKFAGDSSAFILRAAFNVVVMVDPRSYILPIQRHMAYLEGGAAIQNMLLVIHTMGYGACWLNWEHCPSDFNKRFGLHEWLWPVGMVSVGQIKRLPPETPIRKPLSICMHDQRKTSIVHQNKR